MKQQNIFSQNKYFQGNYFGKVGCKSCKYFKPKINREKFDSKKYTKFHVEFERQINRFLWQVYSNLKKFHI